MPSSFLHFHFNWKEKRRLWETRPRMQTDIFWGNSRAAWSRSTVWGQSVEKLDIHLNNGSCVFYILNSALIPTILHDVVLAITGQAFFAKEQPPQKACNTAKIFMTSCAAKTRSCATSPINHIVMAQQISQNKAVLLMARTKCWFSSRSLLAVKEEAEFLGMRIFIQPLLLTIMVKVKC